MLCVLLFILFLFTNVLSVLWFTASGDLFWYLQTFGHCIICPLIYGFWWPLLVSFYHCIICPLIYGFWLPLLVSSNFWSLYYLSFDLRLQMTSFGIFLPLYYLSFDSRLLITSFGIFKLCFALCFIVYSFSFYQCIICPLIYGFWWPLLVSSNFLPLYYLSFDLRLLMTSFGILDLRLLMTSLVS